MAAVIPSTERAEQTVILHNISWETYERLLFEHQESHGTRFSYDQGVLEIMILSLKHEKLKHLIATLVEFLAAELNIDIEGAGSTTFRRQDLARGFEPDACFYFTHAALVRSKDEIDPSVDPLPELAIEVDISHPSMNKQPLMASMGIAEVWRYDGRELTVLSLQGGTYETQDTSILLPGITARQLTTWIAEGQRLKRSQWFERVRAARSL